MGGVLENGEALYRGAGSYVMGDDLEPIYRALDVGTIGRIQFSSPGTGISYTPAHYRAMAMLVRQGEISVVRIKDKGLTFQNLRTMAQYDSEANRLLLLDGAPEHLKFNVLVHEFTHAIQDWLNGMFWLDKHIEADAYIAGAVASHARGPYFPPGDDRFALSYHVAAPLVLSGKATWGNKPWERAYQRVVDSLDQDPFYEV